MQLLYNRLNASNSFTSRPLPFLKNFDNKYNNLVDNKYVQLGTQKGYTISSMNFSAVEKCFLKRNWLLLLQVHTVYFRSLKNTTLLTYVSICVQCVTICILKGVLKTL